MEKQSTVPVVDGCERCEHVAEHLHSIGIEVATRPVDGVSSALFDDAPDNGSLWSGFQPGLVGEFERVR